MYDVLVIGAGAAGFFGAIIAKTENHKLRIAICEKTRQTLAKVRISGGGRCNVTHAEFDPKKLVQKYPRGHKELLGPFYRFQPQDTVKWFEAHGVELKQEADGRMFPESNSSETIARCLEATAKNLGIDVKLEMELENITTEGDEFRLDFREKGSLHCKKLLITTGSNPKMMKLLSSLGHTIEPLVPSLFTFNVPTSDLLDLAGIAVDNVTIKIEGTKLEQKGPLLITHWGFSGPCVLKLSAFAAKELFQMGYKADFCVSWVEKEANVKKVLEELRRSIPAKQVASLPQFLLSKNLWRRFCELCEIGVDARFGTLSNTQLTKLTEKLTKDMYRIDGKTTYKEEFVTCGGVHLAEVNFQTMESKVIPHLYFAGEVLNIDGITGGFNFQNAWTGGFLAGSAIAK